MRYSTSNPSGSARAQSVGGALGTLGGEYSSMFVNPAGVAFFKTSEAAFTLGFQNASNKSTYLNTPGSDNKGSFFISSGAFIFGGAKKNSNSRWENISIGLGINRTNNYNETVYYRGLNNTSSFSDNYLIEAQGIRDPEQLSTDPRFAHGADLAYNTGLIGPHKGPDNQNDGSWESVVPVDKGISQENTTRTKGSANELSLAVGGNYGDQFYIGGSLNAPIYKYERIRTFRETNTSDAQSPLNYYDVIENLNTDGLGFNAKIGAIFKPVEPLRLGVTFHSPTWATFTDTYITTMETDTKDLGFQRANSTETNEGYPDESRYNVTTPWKGIGSVTYVFNATDPNRPSGFLTADYEYMDYSSMTMKFKNDGGDQGESNRKNDAISQTYEAVSNFRLGGELKVNVFAIRAGFAYYGNPYKDEDMHGTRTYYTGGLGYRNKGIYADLAVIYGRASHLEQPYVVNTASIPSPEPAEIKGNTTNVALTVGFKF